jgi:hypothetical protein
VAPRGEAAAWVFPRDRATFSARRGALLFETALQLGARKERRARNAGHGAPDAGEASLFAIDQNHDRP